MPLTCFKIRAFGNREASKWSFWKLHFGASGSSILELLEAPFWSFQKLLLETQKLKNSEAPKRSCQPQNEASHFQASQNELLGSSGEVDHRRSGTHFVRKNTGFRAAAISQKRISCETSFKTPSATPPPAPLAIPFTVRERS